MPDFQKEIVSAEDIQRGTSDRGLQDSKDVASEYKDKPACSSGNGSFFFGSSSSRVWSSRTADQLVGTGQDRADVLPSFCLGASLRSLYQPANGQDGGSDVPAAEDLILVEEGTDHPTIGADASGNIALAVEAQGSSTSLVTSYEIKKPEPLPLAPMLDLSPPDGNFYQEGNPGVLGMNIGWGGMLMTSSFKGYMHDGSKLPIWNTVGFGMDLSSGQGICSSVDVCVSETDDVNRRRLCGEDGPHGL